MCACSWWFGSIIYKETSSVSNTVCESCLLNIYWEVVSHKIQRMMDWFASITILFLFFFPLITVLVKCSLSFSGVLKKSFWSPVDPWNMWTNMLLVWGRRNFLFLFFIFCQGFSGWFCLPGSEANASCLLQLFLHPRFNKQCNHYSSELSQIP